MTCESPPRAEIPAILAESDIGLLTRDDSVGSAVACPVKFAEYLAAGLPVVASAGVGECDAILRERCCGVSLGHTDRADWQRSLRPLIERLRGDREGLRHAARSTAEELFHWDRYLPTLREAYGLEPPLALSPVSDSRHTSRDSRT